MQCFAPTRLTAITVIALAASLSAQSPQPPQAKPSVAQQLPSTLPATQPTTPEPLPIPLTPSQLPPKRAQVNYTSGTLSISADNASLNQILRQIAHDTGMKITGGVADERVFGQYGPDDPAKILAALLDGTGSNVVLVHGDGAAPAELILTPRRGGPTPPNPSAAAFDDRSEQPGLREAPPIQAVQPVPASVPTETPATPAVNPVTPGATQPDPSQPESPNGVKTPQQIYEQLQRLRQQQQQQQSQPQ
jgi:hypothetical protein